MLFMFIGRPDQKASEIKSEIKNVFIADLAIIMLCEVHIFIEISIFYVICSVEKHIMEFGLAH